MDRMVCPVVPNVAKAGGDRRYPIYHNVQGTTKRAFIGCVSTAFGLCSVRTSHTAIDAECPGSNGSKQEVPFTKPRMVC